MNGKIHSIESFGTVDGPGIRFVIFLKGCNLKCLYCHNPDTWSMYGAKEMSVEELLKKYDGVKEFITGGITVTGGEPLLQIDFLIDFFKAAKEKNIHTCLDTSGSSFDKSNLKFKKLIKYLDLVLLDLKHIDSKEHFKLTQYELAPILEFMNFLNEFNVPVWIRHVVIPDLTLDKKYLFELGRALKKYNNITGIEVLPYHTLGVDKYKQLNKKYPLDGVRECTKDEAIWARKIILLAMNTK